MKAILKKIENKWTLIIKHEDGTYNDYRFDTKAQAKKWAKAAGVDIIPA